MPKILDSLVANAAYFFIAVGVIWLAVALLGQSYLILWPVVACIAGGVMLREWPSRRLSWAWCAASAVMGFLLSAYQVYAWLWFLGGAFSTLASLSSAGFARFSILHIFLFYAGISRPAPGEAAPE